MDEREYLVYAVQDNERVRPCTHAADFFHSSLKTAQETAKRLSERDRKPYYVIEVAMVCNTVAVIEASEVE